MRISSGDYKLELTQEELNTVICGIGQISGFDIRVWEDEKGIKCANQYKMYKELKDYLG